MTLPVQEEPVRCSLAAASAASGRSGQVRCCGRVVTTSPPAGRDACWRPWRFRLLRRSLDGRRGRSTGRARSVQAAPASELGRLGVDRWPAGLWRRVRMRRTQASGGGSGGSVAAAEQIGRHGAACPTGPVGRAPGRHSGPVDVMVRSLMWRCRAESPWGRVRLEILGYLAIQMRDHVREPCAGPGWSRLMIAVPEQSRQHLHVMVAAVMPDAIEFFITHVFS